jgi:DNA replication and repair protein RecF
MAASWRAKQMAADQCSTGEQKALLISLILGAARAYRAEHGSAPLILLDEIAAHLDLARRAALYDLICDLGGQVFMTGTGAELFAELGPRAQHFSVIESDGASKVAAI